jgi:hypothetical protein
MNAINAMNVTQEARGQQRGLSDKACREKYWSELTDAEKVERMREILKRSERRNEELQEMLHRLAPLVTGHQHGSDGRPVVPADRAFQSELRGYPDYGSKAYGLSRISQSNTGNPDDVYF